MKSFHRLFIQILMVASIAICCNSGWCQDSLPLEEMVAPYEDDEMSAFNKTTTDTPTSRIVPDSVPARLKNDKAFAYANDASLWAKKEKKESNDSSSGLFDGIARFLQSGAVRAVFYLIVALAVIWIIYRLAVVNNLFVFSSRKKKNNINEDEEQPLTEEKIRERIETAVRNGDYRLATRLLYIETLQWLDQLQLIRYQADATNQEYVQQMDRTPKGKEFRQLTRVFDYVWYGKFPVSGEKFEVIRKNFKAFNQSARN